MKKFLTNIEEVLHIQLSKNFKSEEFACKCCGKCEVDPKLIEKLQLVRSIVGVPIYINSGYRCDKHNREVCGSSKSQHVSGKAADIRIHNMSVEQMYNICKGFFNGVGIYPEQHFIHVDVRDNPTTWVYLKSKKQYLTLEQFEKELEQHPTLNYLYTTKRP